MKRWTAVWQVFAPIILFLYRLHGFFCRVGVGAIRNPDLLRPAVLEWSVSSLFPSVIVSCSALDDFQGRPSTTYHFQGCPSGICTSPEESELYVSITHCVEVVKTAVPGSRVQLGEDRLLRCGAVAASADTLYVCDRPFGKVYFLVPFLFIPFFPLLHPYPSFAPSLPFLEVPSFPPSLPPSLLFLPPFPPSFIRSFIRSFRSPVFWFSILFLSASF